MGDVEKGAGAPLAAETPSETEAVQAESAATVEEQSQQPTEPDIWGRVSELDADELIRKHPKLAGKLGDLANKQARQLAAAEKERWEQDQQKRLAEREAEELDQLAESDPYALAERVLEKRAKEKAEQDKQQAEVQRVTERSTLEQAVWGDVDKNLLDAMYFKLPPAAQQKLAGKTFSGATDLEARQNYAQAILDTYVEIEADRRVTTRLKDKEKTLTSAITKDVLGEANSGEPSPDVGAGTSGALTQERAWEMLRDRATYLQHKEEIDAALFPGQTRRRG